GRRARIFRNAERRALLSSVSRANFSASSPPTCQTFFSGAVIVSCVLPPTMQWPKSGGKSPRSRTMPSGRRCIGSPPPPSGARQAGVPSPRRQYDLARLERYIADAGVSSVETESGDIVAMDIFLVARRQGFKQRSGRDHRLAERVDRDGRALERFGPLRFPQR